MPIMEISIVPVGTKNSSISDYVACSEMAVKRQNKGLKSQITAMGTLIESDSLEKLLGIAQEMHKKALSCGAKRVYTTITIDDRHDKKMSIEGGVESVKRKIAV